MRALMSIAGKMPSVSILSDIADFVNAVLAGREAACHSDYFIVVKG
jgi:hypothetical protein